MALRRPALKEQFLNLILELTCMENYEIRNNAIRAIKKFHEKEEYKKDIEVKFMKKR